jgi:CP family cyanate transporter-like MFS transporter
VLAAVVLLAINLRTAVASLPPLLGEIRGDLGLSGAAAGVLTALPVLAFGVLAPIAPRLARRHPVERVLAACAALTAASLALRGLGGSAPLFAGTLLAGAGVAVAQAALPVYVRTAHPERAGALTGAFSAALPLGATVASAAAVPLAAALDSWGLSLALWGLPALAAAVIWIGRRPATLVRGPVPAPLRGDPLAWAVALYFAIQSMAFYVGLAWVPSVLADDAGYSHTAAGLLLALSALASMPSAFLVPVLAARSPSQVALMAAIAVVCALGALGLVAAVQAAPLWMIVLGIGQGGSLGLALILPVLRGGDPGTVASLTAMTLCVGYLGASLGPWIAGVLHDVSGGWTATLAFLVAISAAQLLPGVPAARDRRLR